MTGHDFLALASRLASSATEEDWRTSISRSYYAVFHVARRLLRELRFLVPRDDKAHAYLYQRLNNCGNPAVSAAAKDMNNLRSARNLSDYDLDIPVLQGAATPWHTTAQNVIDVLDNLTPAERTQIRDATIVYERDVLHNVTWRP